MVERVCLRLCEGMPVVTQVEWGGKKKWGKYELCRTIYIVLEIVNAEELFCQLRDCDFDGYNH